MLLFQNASGKAEVTSKKRPRVFRNISLFAESIDPENVETLKQMYDLRNHIIHGEVQAKEISEQNAMEYVQNAIRLAGTISSLG